LKRRSRTIRSRRESAALPLRNTGDSSTPRAIATRDRDPRDSIAMGSRRAEVPIVVVSGRGHFFPSQASTSLRRRLVAPLGE
jgi:hypothetical protein